MAIMGLANSLMLDFRCLIVPRFIYATGDDFAEDPQQGTYVASAEIKERSAQMADDLIRLGNALRTEALTSVGSHYAPEATATSAVPQV
jgi:FMN reductase